MITATCSECRELYYPQRVPKHGQANYCEACRVTAPSRNSQRRKRNRDHDAEDQIVTDLEALQDSTQSSDTLLIVRALLFQLGVTE